MSQMISPAAKGKHKRRRSGVSPPFPPEIRDDSDADTSAPIPTSPVSDFSRTTSSVSDVSSVQDICQQVVQLQEDMRRLNNNVDKILVILAKQEEVTPTKIFEENKKLMRKETEELCGHTLRQQGPDALWDYKKSRNSRDELVDTFIAQNNLPKSKELRQVPTSLLVSSSTVTLLRITCDNHRHYSRTQRSLCPMFVVECKLCSTCA